MPVNQVALQAGYENHSCFIRLFKRNFGVTPQAYRQNGGKRFRNDRFGKKQQDTHMSEKYYREVMIGLYNQDLAC